MAYLIVNEYEGGTREEYDATVSAVHPPEGLPPGQTSHFAGPSESGWVVIAIWESKQSWETFRDETLMPALQDVGDVGFSNLPKMTAFEVEVEH